MDAVARQETKEDGLRRRRGKYGAEKWGRVHPRGMYK